jgi:hypothetical protein
MYIRAGNSLYCFRGAGGKSVDVTKKLLLDREGVAKFVGAYKFPNGFETSIEIEDGVLLLHMGRGDIELVRTGELTFDGKQRPPMKLTFTEEAGKIQAVSVEQEGRTMRLTRSPARAAN